MIIKEERRKTIYQRHEIDLENLFVFVLPLS